MSILMKGYNAAQCINIAMDPNTFTFGPAQFNAANNDPLRLEALAREQLGSRMRTSNIKNAIIRDAGSGALDIRYGTISAKTKAYMDGRDSYLNIPLIRFGAIPIPKSITLDCSFTFEKNKHDVLTITAVTPIKVYNLLIIRQVTAVGNFDWTENGVYVDNLKTKIKSFNTQNNQAYTGTVDLTAFKSCFTAGEKECDIIISRPERTYHASGSSTEGMKDSSNMALRNLEITW